MAIFKVAVIDILGVVLYQACDVPAIAGRVLRVCALLPGAVRAAEPGPGHQA